MQKINVFTTISLDGYFVDASGDLPTPQDALPDPEWDAFVTGNASGGGAGTFLFGRITYQMMASFWPTPAAAASMPVVAKAMNETPKVVFSRTLDHVGWNNTKLIKSNLVEEVRRLKEGSGDGIVIFGSGTIVSQLARESLIDEYQIIIVPLVLGQGRTMFEGLEGKLSLRLISSRSFKNGNIFLRYQPV